eukprot:53768-Rhodomonas_salina.4
MVGVEQPAGEVLEFGQVMSIEKDKKPIEQVPLPRCPRSHTHTGNYKPSAFRPRMQLRCICFRCVLAASGAFAMRCAVLTAGELRPGHKALWVGRHQDRAEAQHEGVHFRVPPSARVASARARQSPVLALQRARTCCSRCPRAVQCGG